MAIGAADRLGRSPGWLHGLLARWGIAGIFWRSGQTKVTGFMLNESTYDLFRDEYRVPFLPTDLAAVLATVSEHLFPVLLVVGLASRLSAAALFGMTLTIQIFVYPGSWPDHLLWASALVYVMLRGPGELSLDHLVRRRLERRAAGQEIAP
jgi:putative oxidoreductase